MSYGLKYKNQQINKENQKLQLRIANLQPQINFKRFENDFSKHLTIYQRISKFHNPPQFLPRIVRSEQLITTTDEFNFQEMVEEIQSPALKEAILPPANYLHESSTIPEEIGNESLGCMTIQNEIKVVNLFPQDDDFDDFDE